MAAVRFDDFAGRVPDRNTMCLPTRRTCTMRERSSTAAISARRRLQRLRLFAQPYGFDGVAGDPLMQSAGDGFDFGKFGHGSPVYGISKQPSSAQQIAPARVANL